MAKSKFTPGPWRIGPDYLDDEGYREIAIQAPTLDGECTPASVCLQFPTVPGMQDANARLIAAAPRLYDTLNYVADMTFCGADGEWHFKRGYDPQSVLDALANARGD